MYHLQIRLVGSIWICYSKLLQLLCLKLLPCPLQQHSPWRDQPARAAGKMHKTSQDLIDFTASESFWKLLIERNLTWSQVLENTSFRPGPRSRSPCNQGFKDGCIVNYVRHTDQDAASCHGIRLSVEKRGSYWKFVKTSPVPPQHFELPASSAKCKNMQKHSLETKKQTIQGNKATVHLKHYRSIFVADSLIMPWWNLAPQTYQFCLLTRTPRQKVT